VPQNLRYLNKYDMHSLLVSFGGNYRCVYDLIYPQDPGISQLRYDPSADELTCQNDLMSDPSADRWAEIFYHVRSRMRTSCTRLDQCPISHADRFFLAATGSVVIQSKSCRVSSITIPTSTASPPGTRIVPNQHLVQRLMI
jgi:hypothetical protein